MTSAALVFDLDGVILKTNFIKHKAMLSLFSRYSRQLESISAFILANGGVPRREKISRILSDILHVEPTESALSRYLIDYSAQLEKELAEAPFVEGAFELICNYPGARYVCSSAPDLKVQEQINRRSLTPYFSAIYGGSTPKQEALGQIATICPIRSVIFFGDSIGDYEAACEARVNFVAVVCERDNLQGLPVVKLKDFASASVLELALRQCIVQSAVIPGV